jgi:hypothetical protein
MRAALLFLIERQMTFFDRKRFVSAFKCGMAEGA